MPSPGNGVALSEAAHILGVARSTVQQMVLRGDLGSAGARKHRQLDRAEVERLAARRWPTAVAAGAVRHFWSGGTMFRQDATEPTLP